MDRDWHARCRSTAPGVEGNSTRRGVLHKDPAQFLARLSAGRIHRADAIEIYSLDRGFIGQLSQHLDRRMAFSLSVSDRELYVSIGSEQLTGTVVRLAIPV